MRARSLLAWISVGLIGLALAAGVTYAATQLSSQRIGLSAEPPSAGEELAPPAHRHAATTPTTPMRTTTAPPAPAGNAGNAGHGGATEEQGEGTHHGDLDD